METKEELIKRLVRYIYDDELKHFNDEYNNTNIYWDTVQEIELGIKDNWEDCKNHIFVTLYNLDNLLRKEQQDNSLSIALDIMTDRQVEEFIARTEQGE